MALPEIMSPQVDFSAGEVDVTVKRDDASEARKAGLRQCANFRILNTKKLSNRLGRSAMFITGARTDEVLMSPGNTFYLVFDAGRLSVYNMVGTRVFTSTLKGDGATAIPWTAATAKSIVWDVDQLSIYICYADGAPSNVPQVLTWDGVSQTSAWTLATFTEQVIGAGQKRTPFYRISPQGITIVPSATTGNVTVTASAPVFVAGMVGTRIRFVNRQLLITGFTDSTHVSATVEEVLNHGFNLAFGNIGTNVNQYVAVGDEIIGSVSGAKGIVTSLVDAENVLLQMISSADFQSSDSFVAPAGSIPGFTAGTVQAPQAVSIWDDEVMNAFRGYPTSVSVDQVRLIFSNFPSVRGGIVWSAIGVFIDLYVPPTGLSPDSSIMEIVPGKSQVLYVVAGAESSEFVFCDNAIYYIPITAANPLSGTSGVAFNKLSGDGSATVQPRLVQEALIYIAAGGSTVRAISATGAYLRPYETVYLSEFHDHLFVSPIAIAGPQATDTTFPERYLYVLNSNGTLAVGRIDIQQGVLKGVPGWVPESGVGSVGWVAALASHVIFTTTYHPVGAAAVTIAEHRDFNQYLDGAISYNSVPAALAPAALKGPLWWLAGGTCTVLDLGTRQLGTYTIDANGFLVAQFEGGENLASAQLVVGQSWTATAEPFIPAGQGGQDVGQRMKKRRVARMGVYVQNCTGFLFARLFSGPLTRTSPALGTIMNTFRVMTYNEDDDATQAPPAREAAYLYRSIGRDFDPRRAIIKDTAGPLNILEIGFESTV